MQSKVGAILGTVSISVLGIAQLEPQFIALFPNWVKAGFFNWPIEVSVVGLVVSVLLWLWSRFEGGDSRVFYLSGELDAAEIPPFRRYAVEWFGETFASEKRLALWIEKRPDTIMVVRKSTVKRLQQTNVIRGFFILLPLTQHAVDLYKSGEVNGASFLKEHLADDSKTTHGIYIAAIAGSDAQGRSSALMLLHKTIDTYKKQGARLVLARPTTPRGLELANHFGLKPLSNTERDGRLLYEGLLNK
ncbi:MAG: hypothetical protein JWP52_3438 [Rhizobacter sp.]|nr:hypothetical protein [Rhizobacter sp.]